MLPSSREVLQPASGGKQEVRDRPESVVSQIPSASNNQYAKLPYIRVASFVPHPHSVLWPKGEKNRPFKKINAKSELNSCSLCSSRSVSAL